MKLLLIDGNSVLFRAFYATCYGNIMKTSKGEYTNAIYAFANMLNKALKMIEPDYCVVAFDKGKHTFRHDLNPDYKGGRKPAPDELVPQFALVRDMMKAYNIPYLEYDDIEADDIIGSLANKFDLETCILSSDRDLLQLIGPKTFIYMMHKGMSEIGKMDEQALLDEYGLKPKQIIDWKGLSGDKSDNIKGVEGVGDKTAVKLLNDYETCEGIYENIDKIKGKLQERLIKDKESCFLSKTLATIKTDVEIPFELEDFRLNINEETRNEFFNRYEMRSLIKPIETKKEIKKVVTKKVSKISSTLLDNPFIYFMSDDFSYYQRDIWGLCFANEKGTEYIDYTDFKNDEAALAFLASDKPKFVYDLKAIKHCLAYNNLTIGDNCDDICLMAYLCNNNLSTPKEILNNYGYDISFELKDIVGTPKKPNPYDELKVISYAQEFASVFAKIYQTVLDELKEKEMFDLYKNIELKLSDVLYHMEKAGIHCDVKELDNIANATKKKIDILQETIFASVGHEFNIASPKQLADVLYGELDLPDFKKGSTNAEVLNKLVGYNTVVSDVLEYRKYTKLYSTYAEGLKKYISEDGKIHTIFSQTITQTGRLSSYEPNLQNISIRDDESREIRKAFKPSEGNVLISSDYSQVELRVLAHLANEEKMIEAFNSGIDIHVKTAMDVFKVAQEDVSPLIRRHAKAVNFGVVYGISDFGLANQTSLSFKDAKKFIDDYFLTYPNIKTYLDSQVQFCEKNGYVKTMLNRRRYIKEISDRNYMMREFGKRAAMNAGIQGSAADLIKIAMINISKKIKENNLNSKLILQVHDELIFDVPKNEEKIMQDLISDVMANAYKMKVRLDYSMSVGSDWYEAK